MSQWMPDVCRGDGTRIDAILFDLDGVLLDTEPVHCEAWRAAVRHAGLDETRVDPASLAGVTDAAFVDILVAAGIGVKNRKGLLASKDIFFHRLFAAQPPAFDGLAPMIERLWRGGVPMAVVTSSTRRDAEVMIHAAGMRHFFEVVVTVDDVSRPKPDPEPYLMAARKLGVLPKRCMVIEDSVPGLAAGAAAGCVAVATTGALPKERLPGAARHFPTTVEALRWFARSKGFVCS